MVKNTRKKNIKHKTNKRKTKKVQVGGFSYDTWKNTINDEDNLDELNRYLTEINGGEIDKVDIDKKDELINLINSKISKLSIDAQPAPSSITSNANNDIASPSDATEPIINNKVDTDAPITDIPSAPPIDIINQIAIDIDDIVKNIPQDIQTNPEILKLIEQIKSKTARPEQIEQINDLSTQYKMDMQPKPTVEASIVTVDAMPVDTNIGTDLKSNNYFDDITANEFIIKAPISIKDKIMKVIEDNNCSVTTSIFDSNGNLTSTN